MIKSLIKLASGLPKLFSPPLLGREGGFHRSTADIGAVEHCCGAANAGAYTTVAVTANAQYWWFFVAPNKKVSLTQIAFEVTTASADGTLGRIYLAENSNADSTLDCGDSMHPGLILADSGNISVASTGLKTYACDVDLKPGRMYWIGVVSDSTPTLRARANGRGLGGVTQLANSNSVLYGTRASSGPAALTYAPSLTTFQPATTCPMVRYTLA